MALLKNRQFWVAVLALLQTVVLNYLNVPAEIWASIDAILVVVIGAYTVEQVATIKAENSREIAIIYSDAVNRAAVKVAAELAKKRE
jgi:hypothetical protein